MKGGVGGAGAVGRAGAADRWQMGHGVVASHPLRMRKVTDSNLRYCTQEI